MPGTRNDRLGESFRTVRCNPLHVMLDRVGRSKVDFWSLDVEGHEQVVLDANHRLAGEDLIFNIELVEIKAAA